MKEEKSFEIALSELEEIIKKLENGNIDLDESLDQYKKAMELVKLCNNRLENAVETVNKVMKENGQLEEFKPE